MFGRGLELMVLLGSITFLLGLLAGVVTYQLVSRRKGRQAEETAARMIEEARRERSEILLAAKDEAIKIRNEAETEYRERRAELQRYERRLQQKEESLDRKLETLERRERKLADKERELEQLRAQAEELKAQRLRELERISGLSREEAKQLFLSEIEEEAKQDAVRLMRQIEQEARDQAEEKAKKIISIAMARCASEYVAETTVTTVPIPNEEMKGRIIGREGRNIRALEQLTGVDLIVDDTPDAVTLSGFDPVRREVARRALTKLIADGRIHPARIEEVVAKARQEVEQEIKEEGERAAYEANVQGLHPELIKLLGRLKYRTSYGQNQLAHAVECAQIAAVLAAELGADVNVAKTAALLHDIGKAVSHEIEGPHALIGAEIVKRFGRSQKIVHAIASHHAEEEPQTVEAWIVMAADAISGSRPGARRETVEAYIKRLEALEQVANSFKGVEKSFAIQAGREVRILVKPEEVDDLQATRLAKDIVKKIEESLEYPGQIKVTVIRETRAVEYAR